MSHRMDDAPFEVGRAYDVEVRATGESVESANHIEVLLDGVRVINFFDTAIPPEGGFALKAWGSTARFSHVKVWARNVALSRPVPGVWIPFDRATGIFGIGTSSQGFTITVPDTENNVVPPGPGELLRPLAAQQHGFNDCNNVIGEVTSHSVFLSALMAPVAWAVVIDEFKGEIFLVNTGNALTTACGFAVLRTTRFI